jgi:hypothetical protein
MVAIIAQIESAFIFRTNQIFIPYRRSQISELCHNFKESISYNFVL